MFFRQSQLNEKKTSSDDKAIYNTSSHFTSKIFGSFLFLCVHRSRRCKVACVNKDYIMIEVTKKWFIYTKRVSILY